MSHTMMAKSYNSTNISNPLLKHIGKHIDEFDKTTTIKVTFESLVKYIMDNKDLILDPYSKQAECQDKEVEPIVPDKIEPLAFQDTSELNNLPKKLMELFSSYSNSLIRIGVLSQYSRSKKILNLSPISSILSCLIGNFINKHEDDQNSYIKIIHDYLVKNIFNKSFEQFGYKKFKWDQNKFYQDIVSLNFSYKLVRFIADIFHINIFILNIQNDNLEYCGSMPFVPYKKNIFLLLHSNDILEPVFFKESKYLSHNSPLITHLIANPTKVKCVNFNDAKPELQTPFAVDDESLNKYIPKTNTKLSYKEKMLGLKMGIFNIEQKKKEIDHNASEINGFTEADVEQNNDQISDLEEDDEPTHSNKNEPSSSKNTKIILSGTSDKNKIQDNIKSDIKTNKSDSDKESQKNTKYNSKELGSKKIAEIQEIAKKLDIPLNHGVTKTGKPKSRTKIELIAAILQKN